jgi:tRNA-Thr(GGU) m(6)t(6)A37 methyltransferase TsaA
MNYIIRIIVALMATPMSRSFSVKADVRLNMRFGTTRQGVEGVKASDGGNSSGKKPRKPRVPTTPDRRWEVRPIGFVESPYHSKLGMPRQATVSRNDGGAQPGCIHLFEEFWECTKGIDGFDYIWVIALMHTNRGYKSKIVPAPRVETDELQDSVGLFASRAPHRPNPIALSCLKVTRVDESKGEIHVFGLDLLHDTPVLDVKPYCPAFDAFPSAKSGWMDKIYNDPLEAREEGYQGIVSKRGQRQARNADDGAEPSAQNSVKSNPPDGYV